MSNLLGGTHGKVFLEIGLEPFAEFLEAHGVFLGTERYAERLLAIAHGAKLLLLHELGEEAVVGNEDEFAGMFGVFILSDDSDVQGPDVDDLALRRSDGDGFADAVL